MTKKTIYITIILLGIHSILVSQNVERMFVHTDRDIYVSGEDLLFSVYLLDGAKPDSAQSERSIVSYIELINANRIPVAQLRCRISDGYGSSVLSIPDSIGTGEYILRAYTRYMRNFSPEIIFCKPLTIYNPFSSQVITDRVSNNNSIIINSESITSLKSKNIIFLDVPNTRFRPRDNVSIRGKIDSASFSDAGLTKMSVSIAVSSNTEGSQNIEDYISQYKMGTDYSETAYNDGGNKIQLKESYGPHIEGSIISKNNLVPEENTRLFLSIPGKECNIQYATTDREGLFSFVLPPMEGRIELILQAEDFSDSHIIKIFSPFADQSHNIECSKLVIDDKFLEFGSRLGVNYQVNKIYELNRKDIRKDTNRVEMPVRFYGKPDIQVNMNDYIDLPTMEEIFHELVPGVSLKKEGSGTNLVMTNIITGEKSSSQVRVFLDGVLLDSHSYIAGLDPELIERIDIVKRDYQLGNIIFKGIVNIVSREGDICGIDYPNSGIRTSSEILAYSYPYQNVIYSDSVPQKTHLPDFRSTLYWNPEIVTDKTGNFEFTFSPSDFTSDYTITIQGITDKMEPVYLSYPITISRN